MLKTGLRVRVLFVLGQYGLTRETINMLHEEKKEYDDMLIIESLQVSDMKSVMCTGLVKLNQSLL